VPASATATDYDAFLHAHVHSQPHSVMRYDVDGESLWVKRAGATVPGWRLRVLGSPTAHREAETAKAHRG